MLKENFELLANYNQWMNRKLYDVALELGYVALTKDEGAFFGSIRGTLNHILVGDILWLKRFADHPVQLISLEPLRTMEKPNSLSSLLHENIQALNLARVSLDKVIIQFCKELNDELLSTELNFKDMQENAYQAQFGKLIQHFFNHQTHHRGQITTLFSQRGIDIGSTDLLKCIREL